jgi:hypothetical protein
VVPTGPGVGDEAEALLSTVAATIAVSARALRGTFKMRTAATNAARCEGRTGKKNLLSATFPPWTVQRTGST